MPDKVERKIYFHIDFDSPEVLLKFYKINNIVFGKEELEKFYVKSFSRILDFLNKLNIKASFFLVGNEIDTSPVIQNIVYKVHKAGHRIENHTYSHPFGLAEMTENEILNEIINCSDIIENATGRRPVGFRSPGYSIDNRIIRILKENGFRYDSSGFWSVMNPILEYGHKYLFKNGLENKGFGYVTRKLPHEPYYPSSDNWQKNSKTSENFLEIPLPRTKLFGLPFYNNINIWTPELYSQFIAGTIRRNSLVYLFHAIEFVDLSDNIPKELSSHPNIKIPVKEKIKRSEKILKTLLNRYAISRTDHA